MGLGTNHPLADGLQRITDRPQSSFRRMANHGVNPEDLRTRCPNHGGILTNAHVELRVEPHPFLHHKDDNFHLGSRDPEEGGAGIEVPTIG